MQSTTNGRVSLTMVRTLSLFDFVIIEKEMYAFKNYKKKVKLVSQQCFLFCF